jgi:hypothetical protein
MLTDHEKHDWNLASGKRKTTWLCSRCGCVRIGKTRPPAWMLIVLEPYGRKGMPWNKRGVRGPRTGETGLSCAELQVTLVMES